MRKTILATILASGFVLIPASAQAATWHRPAPKTTSYCWTAPTGQRYCSERVVHKVHRSSLQEFRARLAR